MVLGIIAGLAQVAHAGTWVREPGHAYVQVGLATSVTTHRFTEAGERASLLDPRFVPDNFEQVFDRASSWQLEGQVYGELGVLPGLEVVAQLPVRHAVSRWGFAVGDDTLVLRNTALGDAVAGVRAGTRLGPLVGAASAMVRLPLYDNAPERLGIEPGNADIYDDRPPVGPGITDLDLAVALGASGAAWWAQLEAGVRIRNRQFGLQLPARLQVGGRPVGAVAVFAEVEALLPLTDGAAPDAYLDEYGKGPVALDRVSYLRPGLGALWEAVRDGRTYIPGVLLRVDTIAVGRRTSATTTVTAAGTLRW